MVSRLTMMILFAVLLVACGDESIDSTPTATPSGEAPAAASTPTASPEITATPAPEPTPPPAEPTAEATPDGPEEDADLPAIQEIYAQVGAALRQSDMIYYATIERTSDAGLYSQDSVVEMWVDVVNNVARLDLTIEMTAPPDPTTFDVVQIITEEMTYSVYRTPEQRTDTTPVNRCYGAEQAVGVVLGCPGFTEDSVTTVERGEYEGQPAIVLVTTGISHGSDERTTFTSRLYLDPDSFLPIAREIEGTLDYGTVVPVEGLETFQHELIPRDAVPADFFDPLVMAEGQMGEALQPGYTVYWLGAAFDPGNGLPPLVLNSAGIPDIPDAPYDLLLDYRLEDVRLSEHGTPVNEVVIQEWSAGAWDAEWDATIRHHWQGHDCYEQIDIEIPGGRATIFMGYGNAMAPPDPSFAVATPPTASEAECGNTPYTRYEAIAHFGETVLFIYTIRDSEYASREGVEAVLQGLEPRDEP